MKNEQPELMLNCSIMPLDSFAVDGVIPSDGILGFSMTEHPHNGDGGTIIVGLNITQIKHLMTHLQVALRVYNGEVSDGQ